MSNLSRYVSRLRGTAFVAWHMASPVIAKVYPFYGMSKALATAATKNTATSRKVPLVGDLVAALAPLSPTQRLSRRSHLLHAYQGLRSIESQFGNALRSISRNRLPGREIGFIDLPVDTHGITFSLGGIGSTTIQDLGWAITEQLNEARAALYRTTAGLHRWENTPPVGFEWQIVIHHLANVYGRRSLAGTRPLDQLESLVNDFVGADLSEAAIPDDDLHFRGSLRGVRWNNATRWPNRHYQRIVATSTKLCDNEYRIQPRVIHRKSPKRP
ncbi:hypothetical protein FB566_4122 [Stackebrandtia endophytica]|uniref:Uncharacterized protein n=1 Tax=Stackebrandtia endophytica TaxID=1496996 RepID=A0A543B129_9ACTN|nr:hypothetical protein [Stackebrandtia endophytica]TQL78533.1 hypothetical protein FB566_4122 [Stackebrandtia endophytica]